MTSLSPTALEEAAKAVFDALPLTSGDFDDLQQAGKNKVK